MYNAILEGKNGNINKYVISIINKWGNYSMKLFTQEEVAEKIKLFNEYMMKEKQLQEELLELQIHGSKEKARKNLERHDEIIAEIEELRHGKMMPILDEMAHFVDYCERVERGEIKLGDPWPPEKAKE